MSEPRPPVCACFVLHLWVTVQGSFLSRHVTAEQSFGAAVLCGLLGYLGGQFRAKFCVLPVVTAPSASFTSLGLANTIRPSSHSVSCNQRMPLWVVLTPSKITWFILKRSAMLGSSPLYLSEQVIEEIVSSSAKLPWVDYALRTDRADLTGLIAGNSGQSEVRATMKTARFRAAPHRL